MKEINKLKEMLVLHKQIISMIKTHTPLSSEVKKNENINLLKHLSEGKKKIEYDIILFIAHNFTEIIKNKHEYEEVKNSDFINRFRIINLNLKDLYFSGEKTRIFIDKIQSEKDVIYNRISDILYPYCTNKETADEIIKSFDRFYGVELKDDDYCFNKDKKPLNLKLLNDEDRKLFIDIIKNYNLYLSAPQVGKNKVVSELKFILDKIYSETYFYVYDKINDCYIQFKIEEK